MLRPCLFIVCANGDDFFLGNIETLGPGNVAIRKGAGLLNFVGGEGGKNDFFEGIGVYDGDIEVSQYFFDEGK